MLRLLWKEWHELKWYVAGLIVGPWLLSMMPRVRFGFQPEWGIDRWDIHVLMIPLAIWGATRIASEMQSNRLTTRSLPIGPWKLLAAKLVPGLIAALLLPVYMYVIAQTRYPEIGALFSSDRLMDHLTQIFWFSVALYTTSFALSLLMSGAAAAVLSWLILFLGVSAVAGLRLDIVQAWLRAAIALTALYLIVGVWMSARNSGPRRKRSVAARWSVLGMVATIFAVLVITSFVTGDLGYTLMVASDKIGLGGGGSFYDLNYPSYAVSRDGSTIAYSEDCTDRRPHIIKSTNGRYTYALRDTLRQEALIVRSRNEAFEITRTDRAAPVAWTPEGKLLYVMDVGWRMDLLEWDPASHESESLANFPGVSRGYAPIAGVTPDRDCRRIALFVNGKRGSGLDLWVLDRQTGKIRLIKPALDANTWNGVAEAAWSGDRLIFNKWQGREFWSIRADGSEYRRLLPGKEAKSDA